MRGPRQGVWGSLPDFERVSMGAQWPVPRQRGRLERLPHALSHRSTGQPPSSPSVCHYTRESRFPFGAHTAPPDDSTQPIPPALTSPHTASPPRAHSGRAAAAPPRAHPSPRDTPVSSPPQPPRDPHPHTTSAVAPRPAADFPCAQPASQPAPRRVGGGEWPSSNGANRYPDGPHQQGPGRSLLPRRTPDLPRCPLLEPPPSAAAACHDAAACRGRPPLVPTATRARRRRKAPRNGSRGGRRGRPSVVAGRGPARRWRRRPPTGDWASRPPTTRRPWRSRRCLPPSRRGARP